MNNPITNEPAICYGGKPCILAQRYPVETVLEWHAGGMMIEDIHHDYPDLEHNGILTALACAERLAHVIHIEALGA